MNARMPHAADSKRPQLSVAEFKTKLKEIAEARGPAPKIRLLTGLLSRATPIEAKYIIRIFTSDLRIGSKESLVEEAIAKAFGASNAEVRRANMLLGDISETLRLAAAGRLAEAKMRMYHPIGMMLATPVQSAEEAFSCFTHAQLEDKYDGIRAQAHCGGRTPEGDPNPVRIFSRTYDDVTGSFPELIGYLQRLPRPVILDGEIVAWQNEPAVNGEAGSGRALPFSELQKRLGRKKVSKEMIRDVPVTYVAFDVLYSDGELTIEKRLSERRSILERILTGVDFSGVLFEERAERDHEQTSLVFPSAEEHGEATPPRILLAPIARADSAEEIDSIFVEARVRGNEGLMIKDLSSAYLPGRRGQWWLKMKRELATLDVVVTAAEYGHGKRAPWLSDYTFAVRAENGDLLNVGKAYSGLTDEEIKKLTEYFLAHTLADEGWRKLVEPSIVLEVAFNNVMISDRHASGYALRFPRIARIRRDKTPEQIDSLEAVKRIYESQGQK